MNTQITTTNGIGRTIESVLLQGDLKQLTPELKVSYYNKVCDSLGLNPLTQPFAYIVLNGKETLYAKRDATEQLRKIHGVSITISARELVEDLYIVTAKATDAKGRCDESIGAVPLGTLKGEARANAIMKAETKAKRRVTLSICGLGLLDETEVDSIPDAVKVTNSPADLIPEFELPESTKRQLEPPKCELEPLENPWLYRITRRGVTKYLAEVEPKWFNNIVARFGHGQMTEEEYVNAAACLDQPWLKDVALEEIANERSEQEGQ